MSKGSPHSNHATFFYAQLAAVKLLVDDGPGAQDALNRYFNNQFMDHIAASGEQPFEAVRVKSYHYRCFNLEAMIVSQIYSCHVDVATRIGLCRLRRR